MRALGKVVENLAQNVVWNGFEMLPVKKLGNVTDNDVVTVDAIKEIVMLVEFLDDGEGNRGIRDVVDEMDGGS